MSKLDELIAECSLIEAQALTERAEVLVHRLVAIVKRQKIALEKYECGHVPCFGYHSCAAIEDCERLASGELSP